jgi:hypothetical protein
VYNVTTIAHGLGYQFPSKILAWGLGQPLEIEVEVRPLPPGGTGIKRTYLYGTTEYEVVIRVMFRNEVVTRVYRLDSRVIPEIEAFLTSVTDDKAAIKIVSSFIALQPTERKIRITVEVKDE